ncbi:MAG TPA: ankyrin repeat domain-containing protein [Chthoniobacteraceae bacterium]|jgi:ankyrin repeat protein|nr:ankyrin repeat domain-containing protein [Chthoniobacteraceae bacterium]
MEITQVLIAAGMIAAAGSLNSNAATITPEDASRRLEVLGIDFRGDSFARAVALGQKRLVELFLEAKQNPDAVDQTGRTPLFHALAALDWGLGQRLLSIGANPGLADSGGLTPLMLAAAHGNVEMVRALCDRGAALDAQDIAGRTVLHYALAAQKLPIASYLLQKGARVDLRDSTNQDALAYAARTQDWTLLESMLLKSSKRAWDFAGRSALQQAITSGNAERVRLVLSSHEGTPTPEGCQSPLLAYAVAANDAKLTKLLLQAGADPNTTFPAPAEERFLQYVPHKFLRHYLTDEPGMTVLMLAAGMGSEEIVSLLLEHGAERGRPTQSKHRLVPIYFASWGEHAECIQALIAEAPSPDKYRIEISLASQRATLYRDGAPAFRTEISSGKSGYSTPTGQFVVTDKKQSHMSTIYKVKMPFFMRLSCKDFGMHEGYVPDYPASHGCIRVPADAARKLFKEVPIGTLVTITN